MRRTSKKVARIVFVAVAGIVTLTGAAAPAKLEEGLSTGVTRRGQLNRVDKAYTTDQVYYWIRVEGSKEGQRSVTHCVVTDPRGVPIVDSKDAFEGDGEDDYLFCGVDGDDEELAAGSYKFEISLNGEKVGERIVPISEKSFFAGLSSRKKYRYALGVLGLIVLVGGWMMKKVREKKGGETPEPPQGVRGVVIGSNVPAAAMSAAAAPAAQKAPAAPPPPTSEDLAKNFKAKVAADADFRIARAEDVLPIAKAARAAGDSKTAIAAVRGFDKTFPGHALIPDVFVFSAKLLAEDLRNPAMARKILEHVVAKYPGHHLAQEARNYLKGMPQTA